MKADAAHGRVRRTAPGSRRLVPVVVVAVLVAALAAAGAIAASSLTGRGSVAAPNLVGLAEEDAATAVARIGLRLTVEHRDADDAPGLVLEQQPASGTFVADGGGITVVVSRGPPSVGVPRDLAGAKVADATFRLEQLGFVVRVERAYDETIEADLVVGTDPEGGASAARDSEIVLRVSDGPAPVAIPDTVVGKTYDEAAAILVEEGFTVERSDVFHDTVEVGVVVGTDPPVGELHPKGATVTVEVSKGPELVTVPGNLVGMTVEQASQALRARGLVPDVKNYDGGKPVRATAPAGGSQVKKGSEVTLFL